MGSNWTTRAAWIALIAGVAGCNGRNLPGHYWELDLSTADDACNNNTVAYSETLEYRLTFGVDDVTVAIGEDVFAAGDLDGCRVTYDTITWTETREAGDIQWTLTGEAIAQREEGSCGIASDWQGTEVFTVVSSQDPAIRPGCTYTLNLAGRYIGEVK